MRSVNLLPSDLPRPRRTSFLRVAVATVACAFLFGTSLLYTLKAEEVKELRRKVESEEAEYAAHAWLDRDAERTRKTRDEMLARLESAKRQTGAGLPVQDILARLPQVMPEGVWLVQFALADGGKSRVEGEARSLAVVASFLLSLEGSDYFEDVHLLQVSRSTESGLLAFQAEAQLTREEGDRP